MMFMNTWDIEEAAEKHKAHPILGPATKLLSDLRDMVNSCSDGWAYWPAPVRSAKLLMTMIQENRDPSKNDLKRAVAPIKAFITRESKQLKGKTVTFPV